MKSLIYYVIGMLAICMSCSDDEVQYDPYHDWQVRNESWYRTIADSARTAIREAKVQYGDLWEDHCQWRMLKRLDHAQDYNTGLCTDSICVRIVNRGTGTYSPLWSDSVRISFRGWLMPTTYKKYNQDNQLVDSLMQEVFTQTYYGDFNEKTAAPQLSAVTPFVTGFSTALQYMVEGDDWLIYVPHQLAYGSNVNGDIPAYSTLAWRIHMAAIYPCGSSVPEWKAPRRY